MTDLFPTTLPAYTEKPKSRAPMTHEEATELAHLWQRFKEKPDNKPMRDKLILRYTHLVRYVVSRLPMTLPVSISQEDLISYGIIGLIESVERFDPKRGLKFETYAITRIRGSIIDQLRVQDWVPRGVRKRSKELAQAMARLEIRLGRVATEEELAEDLKVPMNKLRTIMAESNHLMLSLDEHWRDDGGGDSAVSLIDSVVDLNSPDPQGEYEVQEMQTRLSQAIESLPEREKLLIALYYHENMTLKEIGDIISVSESRVCQLHAQAVLRLRNKLSHLVMAQ